jgi:YD repeat-containing protein
MTYDTLGRMVTNTEPNVGTWTYAYDDLDQLVGTSDARGCGQNVSRDLAERVISKDYLPCASAAGAALQATYSAPQPNGDGTEELYVYDSLGQLTDAYDLARHDSYSYYANGLVNTLTSHLAIPSGGSALASRYANVTAQSTTFQKQVTAYSMSGQPMAVTTVNSPSTFPSFASFGESVTYSQDDRIATTAANFADWSGNIVSGVTYNPDGTLKNEAFGDAAGTNAQDLEYDNNGVLLFYHLTRNGGAYTNRAFINTINPPPPDIWTDQADLMTLFIATGHGGKPASGARHVFGAVALRSKDDVGGHSHTQRHGLTRLRRRLLLLRRLPAHLGQRQQRLRSLRLAIPR